jgi:hypothetical protein
MIFGNAFYEIAAILGLAASSAPRSEAAPAADHHVFGHRHRGRSGLLGDHQEPSADRTLGPDRDRLVAVHRGTAARPGLDPHHRSGGAGNRPRANCFHIRIGFFIALFLEMSVISAAYVAVALTFSSTIIIVKLLSDKKEIDSLHGRIAVGFLIVQDIAAISWPWWG